MLFPVFLRLAGVRDRLSHLKGRREMSDLGLLASDENWWFGETVKDFTAHRLVLGAASPVLHKILYELDEESNPGMNHFSYDVTNIFADALDILIQNY